MKSVLSVHNDNVNIFSTFITTTLVNFSQYSYKGHVWRKPNQTIDLERFAQIQDFVRAVFYCTGTLYFPKFAFNS